MSRKSPVFTYYDHIMQITDLREQLAARDAELAEAATKVRKRWLRTMGMDEPEIDESCATEPPTDLDAELVELDAIIKIRLEDAKVKYAELAEARAEIERLRGVISVIYARAKSQPTHICEVADFDLSIIADECSAALAPAPPEREERPVRPVLPSNEPWDNGFQGWPPNWPLYKQACFRNWDDCCDMLVGFCKCGASHGPGEFEYKGGVLYRYGTPVDSIDPAAVAMWKRERGQDSNRG